MDKQNVTAVIEQLTKLGFESSEIEVRIEKGLKGDNPLYIDDRPKNTGADTTKFKQVMDALMGAVKPSLEVDIAKSASAAAAGAAAAASGATKAEPTLAHVLERVEVSIQKSEYAASLFQNAVPYLAQLLQLNVEGVVNIAKSQTEAFGKLQTSVINTRPAEGGPRAATKPAGADDRASKDETDVEADSIDLYKSQIFQKVNAEIASPDTDGARRHLIGKCVAVLSRANDVPSLKKITMELGYSELTRSAPKA